MQFPKDDALSSAILATVGLPLIALDAALRVEFANDAFLQQFRVSREETVGKRIYDLGNGQWDIPELRGLLDGILAAQGTVTDYRVEHDFEGIGRRIMFLSARRIARPGQPDLILVAISDDTEREALRQELTGRIELADKLIGSVREGLLILESDLRVRSASTSFYDTFAVSPEETRGRPVYELGNGQWDIPELRQLLEDVLPRQRSFDDYEVVHTFEDIGERVMLLNGRRLDHMDLVLLAIRDVTAQRESAAHLREVASAANVGVFEIDPRSGRISWSPEMREILGYPQHEPPPPAGTVPAFVHPEDRSEVARAYDAMTDPDGGGRIFHEHRIVRPDGEVRWLRFHGQTEFAVDHGQRRPLRLRGVVLDITESKRAEAARHRAHSLLEGIAGGAQDLIAAVDSDLRLLYANAPFLREYRALWGHDLEVGENLLDPLAPWPDERRKARDVWSRALSGEAFNIAMGFGPTSNDERVYDLRFSPLLDDRGKRIGATHILRDITDQTRREKSLREREARQAFLLKLGDALRSADGPAEMTRIATRLIGEHLDATGVFFVSWPPGTDQGEVAADFVAAGTPRLAERTLADMLRSAQARLSEGVTWIAGDAATADDIDEAERAQYLTAGVAAWVDTPLLRDGELHAALCVVQDRPRDWKAAEVKLIEEVAERCWSAVERSRAEKALRESEERQALLLKLSDTLRPLADPVAELNEAMQLLIRHLGLKRAAFYDVDEDRNGVTLVAGVGTDSREWPENLKMSDFAPDIADAYQSARTYVIDDADTDPRLSEGGREAIRALGVRSLAGVPLTKDGRLLMVLSVQAALPRQWTDHELRLLGEAAERIWSSTERARGDAALRETTARLRDARQRLELATDSAGLGVWEWFVAEDRTNWENARTHEIFGLAPDSEPLTYPELVRDVLHPDDREAFERAIEDGWCNGDYRVTCRVRRVSDRRLRWVEFSGHCECDDKGRPLRVVGVVADISERKKAEDHQRTLMAELDHRVKNILAVVQSIARQSLGRGKPVGPEAADMLVGRLNSLAQSHALLAGGRWEGARFDEILETAVAPYRGIRADRVVATGPELKVTPKGAQTLNMAFHELVTNAAKYGALSREDGRVTAQWHFAGEGDGLRLVFTWKEQGGPEIEAPPSRKGFGSRLIEQMLTFELGGEVALDYARDGLCAVMELPLAGLRVQDDDRLADLRRSERSRAGDPATLRHKKVLLVEDEYLVAQETAEGLMSAGCAVTGPVATLSEALRIAATDDLDAAVLDMNLNGALVWPAAHALRARGIPIVFTTGYSDTIKPPSELKDAARIEKPVRRERLLTTLAAAVDFGTGARSS